MTTTTPDGQPFVFIAQPCSTNGSNHSIGITAQGTIYSWGTSNALGQLGRTTTNRRERQTPTLVPMMQPISAAYVGGHLESGHSVLITTCGSIYVSGCDRWQQLGLGAAAGGATGYTWEGGQIWRQRFVKNHFITDLMQETSKSTRVRDVALGDDHTVILSENQRDVYTFGKGGEGQLGVSGKPFCSAPVRSKVLSASADGSIAAICAIQHCSLTLDAGGNILSQAGKCNMVKDEMVNAFKACQRRAERQGLIRMEPPNVITV